MKKFGFTLAEVLITLVIIGVIAAITVPALMNKTDDTENLVAYKKALSLMNQALNTEYSLEGNTAGYTVQPISGLPEFAKNWRGLPAIMAKRTNIVKSDIDKNYSSDCASFGVSWQNTRVFATADGMIYCVNEPTNAWSECPVGGTPCASGIVDVNGKKGPNKLISLQNDEKNKVQKIIVNDMFRFHIYDKVVRPYLTQEAWILQGDNTWNSSLK